MRHLHRHFHSKYRGMKVSMARDQERHFHGAIYSIAREGLSLCGCEGVLADFHGHFHGLKQSL